MTTSDRLDQIEAELANLRQLLAVLSNLVQAVVDQQGRADAQFIDHLHFHGAGSNGNNPALAVGAKVFKGSSGPL